MKYTIPDSRFLSQTWKEFLASDTRLIVEKLNDIIAQEGLLVSPEQKGVWKIQCEQLKNIIRAACEGNSLPHARIIFEYPRLGEGSRRVADVVLLLPDGAIAVLEFKHKLQASEHEQRHAISDSQHLAHCHKPTHVRYRINKWLLQRRDGGSLTNGFNIDIEKYLRTFLLLSKEHATPHSLFPAELTVEAIGSGYVNLILYIKHHLKVNAASAIKSKWIDNWTSGIFHVRQSILAGTARSILRGEYPEMTGFQGEALKHAQERLFNVCYGDISPKSGFAGQVIIIKGGAGSGKTLLGVTLVAKVIEALRNDSKGLQVAVKPNAYPILFSGNLPLIAVLQAAITAKSSNQFSGLFKSISEIKNNLDRHSDRLLMVFDEAQRAWAHEHQLENFWKWARNFNKTIVLLVGKGQSIHKNEMTGGELMNELMRLRKAYPETRLIVGDDLKEYFHNPTVEPAFTLKGSVRQHGLDNFSRWVDAVLDANSAVAAHMARDISSKYIMNIFSDKDDCEAWAKKHFEALDQTARTRYRYGWICSSDDKVDISLEKIGTAQAKKLGSWYIAPPESESSCCQLKSACTEFACQGLEIDLPLVAWGNDYLFKDGAFKPDSNRSNQQFDENVYRVLLTRGRQGLLIYCKDESTRKFLIKCGMRDSCA